MEALRWQSAVDFIVLAAAIYLLVNWSREARALRLALSILLLRVGALVANQLDLLITGWVLDGATVVALLALVVVFQPELRRALMRFDIGARTAPGHGRSTAPTVSAAAWRLAQMRCGALIVLVRGDSLGEIVTPGIPLGGQVTPEILVSIFQKGSPVHDGAAIVQDDTIARVSAILPLTQQPHVDERYGTRHRAALGLSERSDAVVVVVSEERGEVSVVYEGEAHLVGSAAELEAMLTRLTAAPGTHGGRPRRMVRQDNLKWAGIALGLSALVWTVTFVVPGRSVRVETIPVEFVNVPPGLMITSQSADHVEVRLRGSEFLFDSVDLEGLVARCDLTATHAGVNTVPVDSNSLEVPLGLKVENLTPRNVRVNLDHQR